MIYLKEYKVIILGAGISGLSCAIYLERAGIDTLIVENNIPGGKLNKIDIIENYPGISMATGSELAMELLEQVKKQEFVYDNIKSIDYDKKIIYFENECYKYQYLIFATGRRERLLELDNEDKYIGKGISLCATCDGALYKDKEVIVVGGGNSAVSEAIYLSNICNKVTLVYRKDNLRADNVLKSRISKVDNIDIIYNEEIVDYLISDDKVNGVKLKSGKNIICDCVFLAIGSIPNSELFIGVKDNGYIIVDDNYETSISGVYASGDVIKKKLYQLITASSEGASVANNIIQKINGSDW